MAFEMPKEKFGGVVEKGGSIAINGVSLTIARIGKNWFWVQVIPPHTWENTNLKFLRVGGDRVNYEIDIVARYLKGILGDGYGPERT